MRSAGVCVAEELLELPTYEPFPADRNPMFLERRVYQGSSGCIYPLPFVDRIAEHARLRQWKAVRIENKFLEIVVLPELGGRVHAARDKTNNYDFIYRQTVIKPALVGLAGPWISGGIEFNWPQHHRPSTFMPTDVQIEAHPDGSKTVWLGEHDPLARMKGMHGICLHPDRSYIELKARLYNRTPHIQTFLWWANIATRVHEFYQSFFPPDVTYVADHAKRAMSTFPICGGHYYGVDYSSRLKNGIPASEAPTRFCPPPGKYRPDDLSWYANIPVPTSYMCMGSQGDFFGGYDHRSAAGIVHVANHRIAPGKKQWTWGNHTFGYAWDHNLTDPDPDGVAAPYIELMAGVFTDNQPDFSYLQPYETKSWSQFLYPIRDIGPAQQANQEAALSLVRESGHLRIAVLTTRTHRNATLTVERHGRRILRLQCHIAPDRPLITRAKFLRSSSLATVSLRLAGADGSNIISYKPREPVRTRVPPPAVAPAPPADISSCDQLYLTGVHLEQYRHATVAPDPYWREALARDPRDSRCQVALGRWHLRRGEFLKAVEHLSLAIERLTELNPNPPDGEAYYQLGLAQRYLGNDTAAYDAFYKSIWNQAWQGAGYLAIAEIDCTRRDWLAALGHLDHALHLNAGNLKARNLRVMVLRELGRGAEAERGLADTMALDPLDWWSRSLAGEPLRCEATTTLDIAHDHARAGFIHDAIAILTAGDRRPAPGVEPRVQYTLAWLYGKIGNQKHMQRALARAARTCPDYCFPSLLEDILVLQHALAANPRDGLAAYLLGNLFYGIRRHRDAIALWESAARRRPKYSVVWRNLGQAYYNILGRRKAARDAYETAFRLNPADARLLYERDQLWKKLGEKPARRLQQLETYPHLVASRDDLTIEFCALLNHAGRNENAREILQTRRFQPWEGGEGQVLGQYVRTCLLQGCCTLKRGEAQTAGLHFKAALIPPGNLGEAKHPLANPSDVHYWLGCSYQSMGELQSAREAWRRAASSRADFQEMKVKVHTEKTFYTALSLAALGRSAAARRALRGLLHYARALRHNPEEIDYFATSLPEMLIFGERGRERVHINGLFLEAQARFGLGEIRAARLLLSRILKQDPNHAPARDFAYCFLG